MSAAANTAINWAIALAIVAIYTLMAHLDGPSDYQAQADQLANLQDIAKTEAAQQRMATAAQAMCGENAGWQMVDETTIQCTTKRGHRTQKVAL